MSRRRVLVVLRNLRWAVVREGSSTPLSLHDRKDDAVCAAWERAASDGAAVVVYGLDGRPRPWAERIAG